MKEFYVPAVVTADPNANATDLLVERVRQTPERRAVRPPDRDGGWPDVTAAEFHRQVVALAKGFVAAGIEPGDKIGFMCKTRYEWTLDRLRDLVRGRRSRAGLRDELAGQVQWNPRPTPAPIAMIVETADHFARFDEVTRRPPARRQRLADRPSATSTSSHRPARASPTTRSRRAAPSPRAATSRRSSTRPARPACPRAASSPTRTSSSCAATRPSR